MAVLKRIFQANQISNDSLSEQRGRARKIIEMTNLGLQLHDDIYSPYTSVVSGTFLNTSALALSHLGLLVESKPLPDDIEEVLTDHLLECERLINEGAESLLPQDHSDYSQLFGIYTKSDFLDAGLKNSTYSTDKHPFIQDFCFIYALDELTNFLAFYSTANDDKTTNSRTKSLDKSHLNTINSMGSLLNAGSALELGISYCRKKGQKRGQKKIEEIAKKRVSEIRSQNSKDALKIRYDKSSKPIKLFILKRYYSKEYTSNAEAARKILPSLKKYCEYHNLRFPIGKNSSERNSERYILDTIREYGKGNSMVSKKDLNSYNY